MIEEDDGDLGMTLHMTAGNNFSAMQGERAGKHRIDYENGISVLELFGPMYPRANMMTSSGATSVTQFMKEFMEAYSDPGIKGIVMDVDSPGGDVRKIGASAQIINKLARQGKKPIAAFGSGYMTSGSYYLASAVGPNRLFADKSAAIGSIGVLLTGQKNKAGEIDIVATKSPHKRPDVGSEEGQAMLRERVDDILEIFASDVASFRGITTDDVFDNYGQGKVFIGPRAKKQGMVDKLTTIGDVVAMVAKEATQSTAKRPRVSSEAQELLALTNEDIEIMGFKDIMNSLRGPDAKAKGQEPPVAQDETDSTNAESATEGQENVTIVQSLTTRTREELEDDFSENASLITETWVLGHKILPAERPQAVCDMVNAKVDDAMFGGEVSFINSKGQLIQGTREEAARARYDNRKPHSLTKPSVKAVADNGSNKVMVLDESEDDTSKAADGAMSEERRKFLMGLSGQGQAALARQNGK